MRIIDLTPDDERRRAEAAALLVDGFADTGSATWTTIDAARGEVEESLRAERISRVVIEDTGAVVGWVGGISAYDGHVWEVHPLVVRRDRRGQGVGRALVRDLEEQVHRRGGVTLLLGSDDENGRTNLGGADLYPDVLAALQRLRNLGDHPFTFYQKVGFTIVGAIPDANGFGKPDILMAKRVAPASASGRG